MCVTALGMGQDSGVILGGVILVRKVGVGGGGVSEVASARLVSLCTGTLDGTAQVLSRIRTGINASEGIGVRSGAFLTTLGPDKKGGLATLTQVEWWPGHQLNPLSSA